MSWLLILATVAAGIANPFQSGLNAELNKKVGQPLWTAIFVYVSGLLCVCLVQLLIQQGFPREQISAVPWWAWLGGAVSVISTVIGLMIAQRLGSGVFTGISITAALVTSVALDHFGLIGFRQHTASPARIAGCVLMVAGLWVIARF